MRRVMVPGVALLVAMAGSFAVADDLESGLQVGDSSKFFVVNINTGQDAGKSFCLR